MVLRRRIVEAAVVLALSAHAETAQADVERISFDAAIARAHTVAPDLAAARAREGVAQAEIGVARLWANPTVYFGTSTQAAKLVVGATVPLVILGQHGAAAHAARAEAATVGVESEITWTDVRAATARAFVGLWLAENTAIARAEAATVVSKLEAAVSGRIEVGSAPVVEGLRVRAERLRADADAQEAAQRVSGAASELGRWIGTPDGGNLRAGGEPPAPSAPPLLADLLASIDMSPAVRREQADVRAAESRAARERALVRPGLLLDVAAEAYDPTFPTTNYRAQLGIEVPLFNQRGPYVEREIMSANAARARVAAERARTTADLVAAYRAFEATNARTHALAEGVLPAAEAAANASEESYALGHAPLITVLDAERARIDARTSLLEARAARAIAWIDVERALGLQ
jgi:outer membrane protein TolC